MYTAKQNKTKKSNLYENKLIKPLIEISLSGLVQIQTPSLCSHSSQVITSEIMIPINFITV